MILAPHWTVVVLDRHDRVESWLPGPAVSFTRAHAIANAWRATGFRFVHEIRCPATGYQP